MLKKKNLFLVVMTLVFALMFTACGKKKIQKLIIQLKLLQKKKHQLKETRKKQEMQKLQLQEKMQDLKNFQLAMTKLKDL